eukprot:GHVP01010429.1.p1 GENE.GHVP01010429.1~~GHVP01010429.1.p1  ORF type:complete len:247 (-),score=54.32 GHVP01010429.1:22-762(-)
MKNVSSKLEANEIDHCHLASHLDKFTIEEKHTYLTDLYQKYQAGLKRVKTDKQILREESEFIRDSSSDKERSKDYAVRIARSYYDRLYKEYAVVNLTFASQKNIGLRWRTSQEVIKGKGQFMCGNIECSKKRGLCTFEVDFCYEEKGKQKQCLVKVRLCQDCGVKTGWRKDGVKVKDEQDEHTEEPKEISDTRGIELKEEEREDKKDKSVNPSEDNIWSRKKRRKDPNELMTVEDEMDDFLAQMFV